ncbi:MAG: lasso peptide biosynthesis B2 protein [bacterium]
MNLVKKIVFYRRIWLLARVVWWQKRLSAGGGKNAFKLLENAPLGGGGLRREDIDRYVEAGLRVGGRLGFVNSCLPRTVIRCILYRRNGIPARAAFGIRKDGGALIGHCWIVDEAPGAGECCTEGFQSVEILPAV